MVRVKAADGSAIAEVGGRTRVVPPRIRRALEIRDRGCRFPGCASRFTDAHHIRHWADGGPTQLDNLVLLCKTHHRLLHEGRFRVRMDENAPERPVFSSPRGVRIPDVPPAMSIDGRPLSSGRSTRSWEEDVPLALYLRALGTLGR